ncbi:thiamin-phosphate pyrophosphorylase [hydrocarbon metagenome]|uniref:thiamine phosphate synthase n=1 Tax=hydrocarbon metagenome TaxID=938273 RepID=A0A0W8F393_9ZZZZ
MAYDLYVITDRTIGRGRSHDEIARRALDGGADIIQLRDKDLPCREFLAEACTIREITAEAGRLFIVNDRIEVALSAEADGVHLGQDDLPVRAARRIAPRDFIIGVSVKSVADALSAESAGADYVALSPTFSTASKDDAGPGHGLGPLREICCAVSLPVLAIGGIGPHNVEMVIGAGADGIAVISSVVGEDDIGQAARRMKALITNAKNRRGNPRGPDELPG